MDKVLSEVTSNMTRNSDDFDAIREIVKQLHWTKGQSFTNITERIFEELKKRGWEKVPEGCRVAHESITEWPREDWP